MLKAIKILAFLIPFGFFLASPGKAQIGDYTLDFVLSKDTVDFNEVFTISGDITNNGLLPLNINILFAYNVSTETLGIPPAIITFIDTLDLVSPLLPGMSTGYSKSMQADEPSYNMESGQQNIITIWPVANGIAADSSSWWRDSVYVRDDSTLVSSITPFKPVQELYIFPNPTINTINLDLRALEPKNYLIEVSDKLGRKILHGEIPGGQLQPINTSSFTPGLYFIIIRETSGIPLFTGKIIRSGP